MPSSRRRRSMPTPWGTRSATLRHASEPDAPHAYRAHSCVSIVTWVCPPAPVTRQVVARSSRRATTLWDGFLPHLRETAGARAACCGPGSDCGACHGRTEFVPYGRLCHGYSVPKPRPPHKVKHAARSFPARWCWGHLSQGMPRAEAGGPAYGCWGAGGGSWAAALRSGITGQSALKDRVVHAKIGCP